MRIALITREYPPETSWGGIGTHYAAFAQGLKKVGCEVEVFTQGLYEACTLKENDIIVNRVIPRKWAIGKRVGGELAGGSLTNIGLFCFSLAREMCRVFSRIHSQRPFDVVEGHEHLGITYFINRHYRNSITTTIRYQTAYHSMVRRGMANWPKSLLVRYLESSAIRSAQCRIATSKHIDELTREDFSKTPVADAIIPNMTCLTNAITFTVRTWQRELLMIFVGRMMPGHKNPDMAAVAFEKLAELHPDWKIEFAGLDIPIGRGLTMWDKCRRILEHCNGRYTYHGVLSKDQLIALYRRARVILIPSKIESYGLVALEAMANGCVPVVADNTALPEVVGEAGVVFQNGSQNDLIEKLAGLISDKAELEKRSIACIERVQTDFDKGYIVQRNIELFERLIAVKAGI